MTDVVPGLVYGLCLAASGACAWLLFRSWRRARTRLLLWTAVGFVMLAFNNLFLVLDMVVLPDVLLWPVRQGFSLLAVGVLLYGFIWEAEQ
jgi:hypothetical protein